MNVEIRNRKGVGPRQNRALRWSATAAVVAVTPKCAMCVLGYLALATGAQVEICGAPPRSAELAELFAPLLTVGAIGTTGGKVIPRPALPPAFGRR